MTNSSASSQLLTTRAKLCVRKASYDTGKTRVKHTLTGDTVNLDNSRTLIAAGTSADSTSLQDDSSLAMSWIMSSVKSGVDMEHECHLGNMIYSQNLCMIKQNLNT